MKSDHKVEGKQFRQLSEKAGLERSDELSAILETFLGTEDHVSVPEFLKLLSLRGYEFAPEFAERTLDLFCQYGFAFKKCFEGGPTLYEHRHLGTHHDHLICTKCRKIVEFESSQLESLQADIAASYGFRQLRHSMDIYGLCPKCLKEPNILFSLASAPAGERAVMVDFTGSLAEEKRLAEIGLRKQIEVEVITNRGAGEIILALGETRLALGREVAKNIIVRRTTVKAYSTVKLSQLKQGQTATIVRVGGKGAFRRRLLEMGFLRGTDLYVEKYAPLRDPIELILKGYHVSVRVSEAADVEVENIREEGS